jgi:hypothetical protein
MDRETVSSTNLAAVGYDATTQTLEVEFHGGRVYQYYGVPQQMYEELMQAPSAGKFFNVYVKERYPYSRIS